MSRILRYFTEFTRSLGLTDIRQVKPDIIRQFFDHRCKAIDPRLKVKVKPHGIVSEIQLLSGLFRWAMEEQDLEEQGLLVTNPCRRQVKRLNKEHPAPRPEDQTKYLDPAQQQAFLLILAAGVKDGVIHQDYADLALVMLATGMRVTAAIHLDFAWITKDWQVKITQEQDKNKTGYTGIVLPIGRDVLLRRRGLKTTGGRVFPEHLNRNKVYRHLRDLCLHYETDATGSYNHRLRHTFGTAAVDAKVALQVIQKMMGHHNSKTTERYAKVRDQAMQEAAMAIKFGT